MKLQDKKLLHTNNSLEHAISAKSSLATYRGLLILRIIDCSNTSVIFTKCMPPLNIQQLSLPIFRSALNFIDKRKYS